MAKRTFKTWVYTSDGGLTFNRKAATDYTVQVDGGDPKIGGALAEAYHTPMPAALKPRVALCADSAGYTYRIVAYTPDAPILTVGATFLVMPRDGGTAITATCYGTEGERTHWKKLTP